MRSPLVAAALALSLFTTAGAAGAAEWIRTSTAPSLEPATHVADSFVAGEGRGPLRLDDAQLVRTKKLAAGRGTVVRFEQRHRGLLVDGRGAALRLAADGRVRLAMVDVARGLDVDATPAIDPETALRAARARLFFPVGDLLGSELVDPRGARA